MVDQHARSLLRDRGFNQVSRIDGESTAFETEWKSYDGDTQQKYVVRILRSRSGSSRAEIFSHYRTEETKQGIGHPSRLEVRRDADLEWDLLKRVAPDAAREISRKADESAARATAGCREMGG